MASAFGMAKHPKTSTVIKSNTLVIITVHDKAGVENGVEKRAILQENLKTRFEKCK